MKGLLKEDGIVVQEQTTNIPDGEMYQSIVYNFKKDGTFEGVVVEADGDRDIEKGKYSISDGKLIMSDIDDPDEVYYADIVDISNKNLILKLSMSYSANQEMIVELHFDKL